MEISFRNKQLESILSQLDGSKRVAVIERAIEMFLVAQSKSNVDLSDSNTAIRIWIRPMLTREAIIEK